MRICFHISVDRFSTARVNSEVTTAAQWYHVDNNNRSHCGRRDELVVITNQVTKHCVTFTLMIDDNSCPNWYKIIDPDPDIDQRLCAVHVMGPQCSINLATAGTSAVIVIATSGTARDGKIKTTTGVASDDNIITITRWWITTFGVDRAGAEGWPKWPEEI